MQEHAASEDKSFSLIQPGSSVATALSEGESKRKHVVLFEINRERYRTINFPLESVRPFLHDNVSWSHTWSSLIQYELTMRNAQPQACKCP